jgi:DNA primase
MDQVDEIKQKIDMVELVSGYVKLKQAGRNFKGLCPFHQEKSPSFMVNPELGIFKCFGCGKGGDCFSFVEEIEGLDFAEALAFLAERAGIKLEPRGDGRARTDMEQMRLAHDLAAQYYHYLLTEHPVGQVARDYLQSRGIDQKLINTFNLGFALNNWDGLKQYLVEKKKLPISILEQGGLLVRSSKGSFYDRFRGRVIFPLRDHKGKTIGFAGRILPEYETDREAKYINSPETPLYHKGKVLYGLFEAKQTVREKDRLVLVEGELDMISSFAAGIREVVAIKGTALTPEHLTLLGRFTRNLILALDSDSAGDAAARRSIELAENQGFNLKVIQIKDAKDPDEIARKNPGQWAQLVDEAVDVYQFYLDSSLRKHDPKTIEGKRRVSQEVLPVMAKISNQVIKAHYTKKLAEVLGVGEESVVAEMGRITRGEPLPVPVKTEVVTPTDQREMLGKEALRLMWEADDDIGQVRKKLSGLPLTHAYGQIIQRWLDFDSDLKGEDRTIAFIKSLPPQLQPTAAEVYLEPVDSSRLDRDLAAILDQLERVLVKHKLDQLTVEIKLAEAQKRKRELKQLQSEFVKWSRRLS